MLAIIGEGIIYQDECDGWRERERDGISFWILEEALYVVYGFRLFEGRGRGDLLYLRVNNETA